MPAVHLIAEVIVAAAEPNVLLQRRIVVDALGPVALLIVGPAALHLDVHFAWQEKKTGLW